MLEDILQSFSTKLFYNNITVKVDSWKFNKKIRNFFLTALVGIFPIVLFLCIYNIYSQ